MVVRTASGGLINSERRKHLAGRESSRADSCCLPQIPTTDHNVGHEAASHGSRVPNEVNRRVARECPVVLVVGTPEEHEFGTDRDTLRHVHSRSEADHRSVDPVLIHEAGPASDHLHNRHRRRLSANRCRQAASKYCNDHVQPHIY